MRKRARSESLHTSVPDPVLGAIVLAAGRSTRLGRPKQLVLYRGEPLLRRAAALALSLGARPVVVVLGFAAQPCREALCSLPVIFIENPEYASGMAGTLRLGLEALPSNPPERLLLLVADQPLLTAGGLQQLLDAPGSVAAARYNGHLGVPAIFAREHFSALASLAGDQGARSLLRCLPVTPVDMPEAAVDVDTPEALTALDRY